jgi:hypothetical protein
VVAHVVLRARLARKRARKTATLAVEIAMRAVLVRRCKIHKKKQNEYTRYAMNKKNPQLFVQLGVSFYNELI